MRSTDKLYQRAFSALIFVVATLVGGIVGILLVVFLEGERVGGTEIAAGFFGFLVLAQLLLIPLAIAVGTAIWLLGRIPAEQRWKSPLLSIIAGAAVASLPWVGSMSALSPRSYALFAVGGAVGGLVYWWLMIAAYPELRQRAKLEDQGNAAS